MCLRRYRSGCASCLHSDFRLTESRSVLPALNDGAGVAEMATGSPVRGFRPCRAGRFLASNLPNPAMLTGSSLAVASLIVENTAPIKRPAAALGSGGLAGDAGGEFGLVHVVFASVPGALTRRNS